MNVSLVPTSAPPTPVEVLNRIVAQFANPVDPKTPFINPPLYAKRKLAAAMFEEAFGEASPISKLVSSYAKFDRNFSGDTDLYEELLEQMQMSWEELQTYVTQEITHLSGQ